MSGREKVSQHLLVLSSGKPGCAGPLRNQKKSEISCLGEESISVYHRVTHQAAGNTCMTPVRGCKVLSRFYLLQETALEFRSRSTVLLPSLLSVKKTAVSTSLHQHTSKLTVIFIRGCQHIQHFTVYITRRAPFLQEPKI